MLNYPAVFAAVLLAFTLSATEFSFPEARTCSPARKESVGIALNRKFDLQDGLRIEFEFQDDSNQTNPFPRLLEPGDGLISLHLDCRKDFQRTVKALLTDPESKRFSQIEFPYLFDAQRRHRLIFTFQPKANCYTLQLDDGKEQAGPILFPIPKQPVEILVGAHRKNNPDRAFSGTISNLKITSPYHSATTPAFKTASTAPPEVGGKPVEHTTVCALPGRHLAFPGLTRLPGGELMAVFREGQSHVCPYGRICAVYSADGGKNWSAPVALSDTPTDDRDPSVQTLPDGRVLLTHGGWNSWMAYADTKDKYPGPSAYVKARGIGGISRYLFSSDGGRTWGKPVAVPAFAVHGPTWKDGGFYAATLESTPNSRSIVMYRGSSDAAKWEKISTVIENNTPRAVYQEPHTAVLPDGTLAVAVRVPADGYMRLCFSKDEGLTWSEPVTTPVKGYPQHLLVLRDGRLLATYGYRYYPEGVRACLSRDGGRTWDMDHELVLQNNSVGGDIGYPVSIELEDGRLMTVYYNKTADKPNPFIEAAVCRLESGGGDTGKK